jgi:transcription elongation factor Elf1
MNLERIACGSCGASLNVPDGVKFVNCLHCGSSLQVRHNESVAYTEVVEKLEEHAGQIAELQDQLREQSKLHEYLLLQNEVRELDERWSRTEERFATVGKDGHRILPNEGTYFLAGLGGVLALLGSLALALIMPDENAITSHQPVTGAGLLVLGLGGVGALLYARLEKRRLTRYENLRSRYWSERADIVRRMSLLGLKPPN